MRTPVCSANVVLSTRSIVQPVLHSTAPAAAFRVLPRTTSASFSALKYCRLVLPGLRTNQRRSHFDSELPNDFFPSSFPPLCLESQPSIGVRQWIGAPACVHAVSLRRVLYFSTCAQHNARPEYTGLL